MGGDDLGATRARLAQGLGAGRGDGHEDGARVGGVGLTRDPALGLQPLDLGGHRRLAAVVGGGQHRDPGRALLLHLGEQPHLGVGHLEAGALGGQPVQPGDHRQQVGAQLLGCGARTGGEAHRHTDNFT